MYESEYVRKMHEDEMKLVTQAEQRKRLEKVFSEHNGDIQAIEQAYSITPEEQQILAEIKEEQELQRQHDEAFLKGFTGN